MEIAPLSTALYTVFKGLKQYCSVCIVLDVFMKILKVIPTVDFSIYFIMFSTIGEAENFHVEKSIYLKSVYFIPCLYYFKEIVWTYKMMCEAGTSKRIDNLFVSMWCKHKIC